MYQIYAYKKSILNIKNFKNLQKAVRPFSLSLSLPLSQYN